MSFGERKKGFSLQYTYHYMHCNFRRRKERFDLEVNMKNFVPKFLCLNKYIGPIKQNDEKINENITTRIQGWLKWILLLCLQNNQIHDMSILFLCVGIKLESWTGSLKFDPLFFFFIKVELLVFFSTFSRIRKCRTL